MSLWFEFFKFLVASNSNQTLNKEIGICLKKHPTNIDTWKFAAYNEAENNKDFNSGRQLLQNCIRINSKDLRSYVEYFLYELRFIEHNLKRRKMLLGEEEKSIDFVNDVKESAENIQIREKLPNSDILSDEILNLKIPKIIYYNALASLKDLVSKQEIAEVFYKELSFMSDKLDNKDNELKQIIMNDMQSNEIRIIDEQLLSKSILLVEDCNIEKLLECEIKAFLYESQALDKSNIIHIVSSTEKLLCKYIFNDEINSLEKYSKIDFSEKRTTTKDLFVIKLLFQAFEQIIENLKNKGVEFEENKLVFYLLNNTKIQDILSSKLILSNIYQDYTYEILKFVIKYSNEFDFLLNNENFNLIKILLEKIRNDAEVLNDKSIETTLLWLEKYFSLTYSYFILISNEEMIKHFETNSLLNILKFTDSNIWFLEKIVRISLFNTSKHDIMSIPTLLNFITMEIVEEEKKFNRISRSNITNIKKRAINDILIFSVKFLITFVDFNKINLDVLYFNEIQSVLFKIKKFCSSKLISYEYVVSSVFKEISNAQENKTILFVSGLEKLKLKFLKA